MIKHVPFLYLILSLTLASLVLFSGCSEVKRNAEQFIAEQITQELTRETAAIIIKDKLQNRKYETRYFPLTEKRFQNYTIPLNYQQKRGFYGKEDKAESQQVIQAALNNARVVPRKLKSFEKLESMGYINYEIKISGESSYSATPHQWTDMEYTYFTYRDILLQKEITHIALPNSNVKEFVLRDGHVAIYCIEFDRIDGIRMHSNGNSATVEYYLNYVATPFGKYIFDVVDRTYKRTVHMAKYDDGWRIAN